jgi:hypothetical protein
MNYAVMQTALEPPSSEQLKSAFQKVPGFTALDVNVLGRDAFGVLVKGLERQRAETMRSTLAAEGVETELVEERVLGELPPPRKLAKLRLTPEALEIDDLLGRPVSLEWNRIGVIAAGCARLTDFTRQLVEKTVLKVEGRHLVVKVVEEPVTKEAQKDHWLLELITTGADRRYHIVADRPEALLLFQCLGERRTKEASTNLALLVRELVKFAPSAVLNHGAYYMCEGSSPAFYYPSQTAFYREITWLLWMVATGRVEP